MTACKPSIKATASGQPEGRAEAGFAAVADVLRRSTPSPKEVITRMRKPPFFIAAVTSGVPLPHLTPRHCTKVNSARIEAAKSFCQAANAGTKAALYSAMTIATAALVPQVDSQSLQPTMKPA